MAHMAPHMEATTTTRRTIGLAAMGRHTIKWAMAMVQVDPTM